MLYVASVAERIKEAMYIRNMKQADICEKTKIPKGSISQYVSGYVEPKTDRIYLIAKALDVSPSWLMGCDVPMETLTEDNANFSVDMLEDPVFVGYAKKLFRADSKIKDQVYSYIDFLLTNK